MTQEQDFKTYLYQQAEELGAWVKELGSVAALVDKTEPTADHDEVFGVTFVIAPESLNLKIRVENADFFLACKEAKDKAIQQANAVLSNPKLELVRQQMIKAIADKQYLH